MDGGGGGEGRGVGGGGGGGRGGGGEGGRGRGGGEGGGGEGGGGVGGGGRGEGRATVSVPRWGAPLENQTFYILLFEDEKRKGGCLLANILYSKMISSPLETMR